MPCGRNRCSPPAKAGSALGPVDVTTLPWLEKVDRTLARRFCRSQTSTITTILAFNPGQGGGSGAVVSNEKNDPAPRPHPARNWPSAGGQAAEHPVHDVRRPRFRRHRCVRFLAEGLRAHASDRSIGRRGHAFHQCLLQQLHLLTQPREHHQRPILPRHRRTQSRLRTQAQRPKLHP